MEADIQSLVTHPTMKVEDGRTRELAHELQCRMEDLKRLQATQIRVEERCRELEKRKLETQQRLERERAERLKAEAMERDRVGQMDDRQRGHADEAALAGSVMDKLKHDGEYMRVTLACFCCLVNTFLAFSLSLFLSLSHLCLLSLSRLYLISLSLISLSLSHLSLSLLSLSLTLSLSLSLSLLSLSLYTHTHTQ